MSSLLIRKETVVGSRLLFPWDFFTPILTERSISREVRGRVLKEPLPFVNPVGRACTRQALWLRFSVNSFDHKVAPHWLGDEPVCGYEVERPTFFGVLPCRSGAPLPLRFSFPSLVRHRRPFQSGLK